MKLYDRKIVPMTEKYHNFLRPILHYFLSHRFGSLILLNLEIGRILIPRFYKTLFASGVSELRYSMRKPVQEYFQQPPFTGLFALTCDDVLVVLKHERPFQSEVCII